MLNMISSFDERYNTYNSIDAMDVAEALGVKGCALGDCRFGRTGQIDSVRYGWN
jgi:hypothetical protein